jgi:hypothetical protein
MKFRKKPIVIDAIQFIGNESAVVLKSNTEQRTFIVETNGTQKRIRIETLEGEMIASPKDWIIRGLKGEFYPCKPDIFEATYEAVKD